MTVTIEINCENKTELFTHLMVVRAKLKKALKETGYNEVPEENIVFDNEEANCYGEHTIKLEVE